MGGTRPPFLYAAVNDDDRFPTNTFDPKAVTRASWESKPPKPKPDGPLVTINRHPDAQAVLSNRLGRYRTMGRKTKAAIRGIRVVQLGLRVFECIGAAGLLALMILVNNVQELAGWVIRITLGVATVHCAYGIYHHTKPAGARTPGSSAAYHVFAAVSDLAVLPLYAFATLSVRNDGAQWGTLIANKELLPKYFIPALYYGFISVGGLHVVSLAISLYLGIMFRRISMMPPDMNPLELNLTSRAHKRNKSSVAVSVYSDKETRLDTPLDDQPLSRPRSIPFMHTRQNSGGSVDTRDSRVDLPSRQYQIVPGNARPNSITSQDLKRTSAPPPRANRGSYSEIPLGETGVNMSRPVSMYSSRPSSGTVASYRAETVMAPPSPQPRAAKFTEAWYTSESLINRTQQRTRALNQQNAVNERRTYEAVGSGPADLADSDSDAENDYTYAMRSAPSPTKRHETSGTPDISSGSPHPNPLRSNPAAAPSPPPRRPRTPFSRLRASVLSDISSNERRVSGSQDITEEKSGGSSLGAAFVPRNRLSSIQPESAFYSKPYGDLRPATPPVMIGSNRQVSSGNDYDLGSAQNLGRRNVSGKMAEEGRAGHRYSRYSVLNE